MAKYYKTSWILLLLLLGSTKAYACLCMGEATVCDAYENAKAIIVGKIVSVTDAKNANKQSVLDSGQIVKVKVHKIYKGTVGDYVDLWQPYSSCDAKFQNEDIGKSLLMYLDHESDPQAYSLRICSRSGSVAISSADISWLDSLPRALERSRISGVITEYTETGEDGKDLDRRRMKGFLSDIAIELSNDKKSFRTKTNSFGAYELWDLPDGRYRFSAAIPAGFRIEDVSTNGFSDYKHPKYKDEIWFEIEGGGCAAVDYEVIKAK